MRPTVFLAAALACAIAAPARANETVAGWRISIDYEQGTCSMRKNEGRKSVAFELPGKSPAAQLTVSDPALTYPVGNTAIDFGASLGNGRNVSMSGFAVQRGRITFRIPAPWVAWIEAAPEIKLYGGEYRFEMQLGGQPEAMAALRKCASTAATWVAGPKVDHTFCFASTRSGDSRIVTPVLKGTANDFDYEWRQFSASRGFDNGSCMNPLPSRAAAEASRRETTDPVATGGTYVETPWTPLGYED